MTLSTLSQIEQGKLWDFSGGIHPYTHKRNIDTCYPAVIESQSPLILHPHQPLEVGGQLSVKVGDHVLGGQSLTHSNLYSAPPIHAPTSGKIIAIEKRQTAHPSAIEQQAIILQPDGHEQWCELSPLPEDADHQQMVEAIHQAGINGMGGAGFPTAIKLASQSNIDLLIINGAECEPYISADHTLMRNYSHDIARGIHWLQQLLQPQLTILAIEDDKPAAIEAMEAVAGEEFRVQSIPVKYPSGGERQLIQILTGQEVPTGGLPADIGVLVQNVGTAYAVCRAIEHGEPLTRRIVTLAGKGFKKPRNVWVNIGTQVHDLLPHKAPGKHPRLIMGGAMMGFTLPSPDIPLTKTSNCILYGNEKEFTQASSSIPCIRCGECAKACPANLLPQQLYWFIQGNELDKAQDYHLKDCIECGACAYVCPSEIPLVQYYRQGKASIRQQHQLEIDAQRARQRTERRNQRLEREKQERELRHQQAAKQRSTQAQNSDKADAIAAAMARVKAKQNTATTTESMSVSEKPTSVVDRDRIKQTRTKNTTQQEETSTTETKDPRKAQVAAAIARAKAKKTAQTTADDTSASASPQTNDTVDPRKAQVAAAIARAKAKKAAQATADETSTSASPQSNETADPRKAQVAAAIARAKAKKAAQAKADDTSASASPKSDETADPRKAKIAEAVARAKAKKAAQATADETSTNASPQTSDTADPRKAKIAEAVARAKAKKAAQATANETSTNASPQTSDTADPRKAKIAAAVARAKAKKAQSTPTDSSNEESSNS